MYLIDGYNLLHSLRAGDDDFPRDFAQGRRRLVDLLENYAIRETSRVTVYFDGTPGRGRDVELARPSLSIQYTGHGEADEAIRVHVATAAHPKRLHVVSSDRAIVSVCRGEGARVIDSPSFARRLISAERKVVAAAKAKADSEQRREWEARLKLLRERMLGIGPMDSTSSIDQEPADVASIEARMASVSKQDVKSRHSDSGRQKRAQPPQNPATLPTPKHETAPSDRAGMARMVDEMLSQVGSFEDVVRDALGTPFPNPAAKPAPNLPDYHRARRRARSSQSNRSRAVG